MAQIPSNAQRERRIQDRMESRMAGRLERRLRRLVGRAIRAGAKAAEKDGSVESAVAKYDDEIEGALRRAYTEAFNTMAERIRGAMEDAKAYAPGLERKELTDRIERALRAFVGKWTGRKVTQISSTTREWVRSAVKSGLEEGLELGEIAANIRERSGPISAWRAVTIARTEVHSAAQGGSLAVASESGAVRRKNWVPVGDDRTRSADNSDYDHFNVESVPVNRPFVVSGEELMHPGDPAGSPGNIVNCRCAMTYSTE